MKSYLLDDTGYRVTSDFFEADYYSGPGGMMKDFHMHSCFELSFVVKGTLTVLFDNSVYKVSDGCLILSRPYTPHYVVSDDAQRYIRYNFFFSGNFVSGFGYDMGKLLSVFKKNGNLLRLTEEDTGKLSGITEMILGEKEQLGKHLLFLFFLNRIRNMCRENDSMRAPELYLHYINDVLRFIAENYGEKLIAADIANRFYISRTKLMADFKLITGITLSTYITHLRLRKAMDMLLKDNTISQTALECGFVDNCNFIRVFKKHYKTTPMKFIKSF